MEILKEKEEQSRFERIKYKKTDEIAADFHIFSVFFLFFIFAEQICLAAFLDVGR